MIFSRRPPKDVERKVVIRHGAQCRRCSRVMPKGTRAIFRPVDNVFEHWRCPRKRVRVVARPIPDGAWRYPNAIEV